MAYTREKGKEFWYQFDNQTLFQRTPEVNAAMVGAYFSHGLTFDSVYESLRTSLNGNDHPAEFKAVVEVGRAGFIELASIQNGIMEAHLEDENGIQSAFEDFGQGVLFDDRSPRPTTRHIHMMDGTPDNWVGYHRWHAFARAAALLGAPADRWLLINRCIALAWAIQTEANPTVDAQNNPGLPNQRLEALREVWMKAPAEKLDWAFANHRFRAPAAVSLLDEWSAELGRYAKVQKLLGDAVGTANPLHGRFWELPYEEFMAHPPVYDVVLIADEGANRGARSGLVKILRGTEPNFPQMPLNRPPMSDEDIQYIETWIDDGCPS